MSSDYFNHTRAAMSTRTKFLVELGLLENITEILTNSERIYLCRLLKTYSAQRVASICLAFQLIEVKWLDDGIRLDGGEFCSAIFAVMFYSNQIW
ncbi:hypothetical protein N7481_013375 [Penicillium waksmanii]|uniref:uncharacterized protein n=1 Tax=Penicillium waksmanii TaxID=69791 RepID=UPI0025499EEE|nr:uncharacterized protein N7481_013375 [Penicillium waksmanii]KAJ5963070.1 hypothetical protein N7481_013375 [Penicillium waksmanii]